MVLVYGTICIDRVRSIRRFPSPGGYAPVIGEQDFLGGEAANTANALRTWGVEILLAGNPLGKGESAAELEALLAEKGLPMDHLERGGRTPVCEIYVSEDGTRTMFGYGFDDMGEIMEPGKAPYTSGAWFTADPNPGDAAREAIRLAHRAGMSLFLMDFIRDDDPIPESCYWQSSTDWAGVRGDALANIAWVEKWVRKHRATCILSDGSNGLFAASPDLPVRHYPAFPVKDVADSTGAGDMLRAGVLLGIERGWPLWECLAFGAAAGALKCRYLGATSHVPSLEEIQGLMNAHPEIRERYGR